MCRYAIPIPAADFSTDARSEFRIAGVHHGQYHVHEVNDAKHIHNNFKYGLGQLKVHEIYS